MDSTGVNDTPVGDHSAELTPSNCSQAGEDDLRGGQSVTEASKGGNEKRGPKVGVRLTLTDLLSLEPFSALIGADSF